MISLRVEAISLGSRLIDFFRKAAKPCNISKEFSFSDNSCLIFSPDLAKSNSSMRLSISFSLKNFETSYVNVFSLNWLFVNGSNNLQRAVGNHGQFYLFTLPFFFIGINLVFKKNANLGLFLIGWMLLGALPGGLTTGNYAYRSIHILPSPS